MARPNDLTERFGRLANVADEAIARMELADARRTLAELRAPGEVRADAAAALVTIREERAAVEQHARRAKFASLGRFGLEVRER